MLSSPTLGLSMFAIWADGRYDCAARQNFNVVRMFGFPVQRGFNLQTSAGVYNEQVCPNLSAVTHHLDIGPSASGRDTCTMAESCFCCKVQ